MGEGQQAEANPARTYTTVAGGALILFGLLGFFYSASFATGEALAAEKAVGIFYVNGWQNLLHLAAGAIGLLMAMRAARLYCLAAGVVWIVLAAGGFFGAHGGETVPAMGGLIPAGTANNLLNLILAGLAFAALAATSAPRDALGIVSGRRKKVSAAKDPGEQPYPETSPPIPRSKANNRPKSQPKVEPESSGASSGIGKPRSAQRSRSGSRRTIN